VIPNVSSRQLRTGDVERRTEQLAAGDLVTVGQQLRFAGRVTDRGHAVGSDDGELFVGILVGDAVVRQQMRMDVDEPGDQILPLGLDAPAPPSERSPRPRA